jgi:hypothetical protein
MFNFGKNKDAKSNVYNLPEPKGVAPMPYVEPPKPKEPATTYYTMGVNSEGRVVFKMGHNEISMNEAGVNNLIFQLESFRDSVFGPPEGGGGGGGGEPIPIPIPEQKAA